MVGRITRADDDVFESQSFVVEHGERAHDFHASQRPVSASELVENEKTREKDKKNEKISLSFAFF